MAVVTHMLNNSLKEPRSRRERRSEAGFTMVEMVVSMVLLLVGLLAMASSIGFALMAGNRGRGVTNAKLLVVPILEQMETLRNTKQLTFGQIANTGAVDNTGATYTFAGFPTTPQSISRDPGPDGIFGTADDFTSAGPDGKFGTADDVANDQTLIRAGTTGWKRQIAITTLSSNIKKIVVTLTYPGPNGDTQTLSATSYLNNDAEDNYLP